MRGAEMMPDVADFLPLALLIVFAMLIFFDRTEK